MAFAVLDTETTWTDIVMSIGIVIADEQTFEPIHMLYDLITPACKQGGMYSSVLRLPNQQIDLEGKRSVVIAHITEQFSSFGVRSIFAYNALFDMKHLKELNCFAWYDIMKIAAYKQYNHAIPDSAECCATGKLKRNYGVEPIMRLLTGSSNYYEVHNALCDAADELKIMKLLGHDLNTYTGARIK